MLKDFASYIRYDVPKLAEGGNEIHHVDTGLVVNGKLKHSGKSLPNIEKVKALIKEKA